MENYKEELFKDFRQHREQKFYEKDGALWWKCTFTRDEGNRLLLHEANGVVPAEVVARGKRQIRAYALARGEEKITAELEQHCEREAFLNNPDFPVSVSYHGQRLTGRIDHASIRYIHVKLEVPLQGESSLNFGWASAIGGHYVMDGDTFSASAIKGAQRLLVEIYQDQKRRQKHRRVIKLAEDLNQS